MDFSKISFIGIHDTSEQKKMQCFWLSINKALILMEKKALHLLRVNPLSLLQQNLLQSMLSATSATLYKHTCCYTCLICNWDNCLLTSALSDKEKCHQKPKASFPIFLTGSIIDIGEISEGLCYFFFHVFNTTLTLTSCITTLAR